MICPLCDAPLPDSHGLMLCPLCGRSLVMTDSHVRAATSDDTTGLSATELASLRKARRKITRTA